MTGAPLFARIRAACREVAARARHVRIEDGPLDALLERLRDAPAVADPAHHRRATPRATLAFVLTLDAVNFGSGWFPHLRKRPGCSGYTTVALALAERFDAKGPWSARELLVLGPREVAQVLGQERAGAPVDELMALYARALRDLGAFLVDRHGGRFEGPVEAAHGSASRLVETLAVMPFYRDVACYRELEVPFYKRAQITVADLHLAFEGSGPGRFEDVDDLTLFADNLVPHVLREAGVLVYESGLAGRIGSGTLLAAGSPEEVEIRACAVEAVERLVARSAARGRPTSARELDARLWALGQSAGMKARPRHRTRCVYY